MQTNNDIALTGIKKGNIYYVEINKTFYFLQIIHIKETNDSKNKVGYFLVVFDKTFKTLPISIADLDLEKIYQPKYLWKKTTLFAGIWNNEPSIKFRKDLMYYDLKDKYQLTYFDNTTVSQNFDPQIIYEFTPQIISKSNEDGIDITYQHLALQVIFWGLEQEEKGKTKKKLSIKPKYFTEWLEYVDPEKIIKTEKIIAKFENTLDNKTALTELKKSIVAINKLDDKEEFITTIEAENLVDKLTEIALAKGLEVEKIAQQIETNRTW
jgi:hypothetical protein